MAARFGTPLYVLSESRLRSNARRWSSSLAASWPFGEAHVLPSLKANLALAVRRILTQEGLGCDLFGPGEFRAAMRAGVDPSLTSLNGSAKDQALIDDALRAGMRITLDSRAELERVLDATARLGVRATVRLRARPDYAELRLPSDFLEEEVAVAEAAGRYKAGIPFDDLLEMGRSILGRDDVYLSGLHVHFARHRAELAVWRQAVGEFARLVGRVCEAWDGWRPQELDVGGGYPTRRDPTGRLISRLEDRPPAPAIEEYAATVAGALAEGLRAAGVDPQGIALEVEPGRSMLADVGLHLATVRNVKREREPVERIWVETDTTEMFLLDSLIEHNRWEVVVANRAEDPPSMMADVVGMSCGFDLMVPDASLPDVREGDVLAFLDTGAYQDATATNFNALPRPATVLVHGADAEEIKRRERPEDVFARDLIPSRLGSAP